MALLNWAQGISDAASTATTFLQKQQQAGLEDDLQTHRAQLMEQAAQASDARRETATVGAEQRKVAMSDAERAKQVAAIGVAKSGLDDESRQGMINAEQENWSGVGSSRTEGATPEELKTMFPVSPKQQADNYVTAAIKAGYIEPDKVMANDTKTMVATINATMRELGQQTKFDTALMQKGFEKEMLQMRLDVRTDPTVRAMSVAQMTGYNNDIRNDSASAEKLQASLNNMVKNPIFNAKDPGEAYTDTKAEIDTLNKRIVSTKAMRDAFAGAMGLPAAPTAPATLLNPGTSAPAPGTPAPNAATRPPLSSFGGR